MATDFDRYRMENEPEWSMDQVIGRGGFGAVYKGQIRRPGLRSELCAVKRIALGRAGVLQRYKREISILASLVHVLRFQAPLTPASYPNLPQNEWFVQFFGWYESEDFLVIAMEYMEFGDLAGHLGDPWSENDTKIVAEQLLKGVTVLHGAGITHRDLKPQVGTAIALHAWYLTMI